MRFLFLDASALKSSMAGSGGASTVLWVDVDWSSSGAWGEINVGRNSCGRTPLFHIDGSNVNLNGAKVCGPTVSIEMVSIRRKEGKPLFLPLTLLPCVVLGPLCPTDAQAFNILWQNGEGICRRCRRFQIFSCGRCVCVGDPQERRMMDGKLRLRFMIGESTYVEFYERHEDVAGMATPLFLPI